MKLSASSAPACVRQFSFGPFCYCSEIDFPELVESVEPCGQMVDVRYGLVRESVSELTAVGTNIRVSAREFYFHAPGVASFHVADGASVTVQPAEGAAPEDIRLFLLGSVFGALCHQTGLLPLHASSVVGPSGRVTAFLGNSGAGKSTLAAFLERRGYVLQSDDICLLDFRGERFTEVVALNGWLRLWRETWDHIGRTPRQEDKLMSREDKYRLSLERATEPADLGRIVLLERKSASDEQLAPELIPLSPAQAISQLMLLTYQSYLVQAIGSDTQATHFRRCAQLLGRVPVYRLVAPSGWDRIEELVDYVERTVLC